MADILPVPHRTQTGGNVRPPFSHYVPLCLCAFAPFSPLIPHSSFARFGALPPLSLNSEL